MAVAYFEPDQIDPHPIAGRAGRFLYRRVHVDGLGYDGKVKYPPELEDLVDDVRVHIAGELDRMASRLSYNVLLGRLYSPVEIPPPDRPVP